jgi:hypothetical protein
MGYNARNDEIHENLERMRRLVNSHVDVIVAWATPATNAVRRATWAIVRVTTRQIEETR